MSRIILVAQEKGGMRKTFLAVHLTRFLQSRGQNFTPVDFDMADGLLARVYPHPSGLTVSPDVTLLRRGESNFPHVLHEATNGRSFVIDSGANTGPAWEVLMTEIWPDLLVDLRKAGVKLTIICPVSSNEKARRSPEIYQTLFPDASLVLAIVREYREEEVALPPITPAAVIDVPDCVPRLYLDYERHLLPIDDIAAGRRKELGMSIPFARGYLPQLHRQFEKILPLLIP